MRFRNRRAPRDRPPPRHLPERARRRQLVRPRGDAVRAGGRIPRLDPLPRIPPRSPGPRLPPPAQMTASDAAGITLLTLRIGAVATLLILVPAVALGYLLARRRFPGRSLLQAAVSLPMVLPPVAVGLLLLQLLSPRGFTGRVLQSVFGAPILLTWWAASSPPPPCPSLMVLGAQQVRRRPRRLEDVACTRRLPRASSSASPSPPPAARPRPHSPARARRIRRHRHRRRPHPRRNRNPLPRHLRPHRSLPARRSPRSLRPLHRPRLRQHRRRRNVPATERRMTSFDLHARLGEFHLEAAAAWEAPSAALFGASGSGKSTIEAMAGRAARSPVRRRRRLGTARPAPRKPPAGSRRTPPFST